MIPMISSTTFIRQGGGSGPLLNYVNKTSVQIEF